MAIVVRDPEIPHEGDRDAFLDGLREGRADPNSLLRRNFGDSFRNHERDDVEPYRPGRKRRKQEYEE